MKSKKDELLESNPINDLYYELADLMQRKERPVVEPASEETDPEFLELQKKREARRQAILKKYAD